MITLLHLRCYAAILLSLHFVDGRLGAEARNVDGSWEGYIETRTDKVGISLTLQESPAGMKGSVTVPMWGNGSWPLEDIGLKDDHLVFRIAGLKAPDGTFDFTWKNEQLSGHYTWDCRDFDVRVGRKALSESHFPRYPQIPPGAEPYTVTPIKIPNRAIEITGLYTCPKLAGRHPAILVLSGDWLNPMRPISDVRVPGDPTILPDGPWLISDQMARKGIAVLRINWPGAGGSGGAINDSTLSDLVSDAAQAFSFLQRQKGIDGQRIGVIGFGDGGVIVPEIASSIKGVRCMALLGTPGLPEVELYGLSARRKLKVPLSVDQKLSAATEWELEKNSLEDIRREERILLLLRGGRTSHEVWATLATELTLPQAEVRDRFGKFVDVWTTDYNGSLLRYDPRDWLRKVTVPSFVAAGDLDVRTCPEKNVPEIQRSLEERCKDLTLHVYPGLSHRLIRPAKMDYNHLIYGIDLSEETVLDPQVLADLVNWLSNRLA